MNETCYKLDENKPETCPSNCRIHGGITSLIDNDSEAFDLLEETRNKIFAAQTAAIDNAAMELLLIHGIIKDKSEYKNPENLRTILKKKGFVLTVEWTDLPDSFAKKMEIIISKVVETKVFNFNVKIDL